MSLGCADSTCFQVCHETALVLGDCHDGLRDAYYSGYGPYYGIPYVPYSLGPWAGYPGYPGYGYGGFPGLL
jgi:hypothetical protein